MARLSRVVVPGLPHHVTQRGVRSLPIFRDDRDRESYLGLLHEQAREFGLSFQAWCLMPNHVHLIVTPKHPESLARGIGEAHRLYTRMRNFDEGVRGYLFQGRFASCVLDERHLIRAARYVEMNPVRAGLVRRPEEYRWSSAAFHCGRKHGDALKTDRKVEEISGGWKGFLAEATEAEEAKALERCLSTGRPWGSDSFVRLLERRLGRALIPLPGGWPKGRGRKRAN
jgi:putative transposase